MQASPFLQLAAGGYNQAHAGGHPQSRHCSLKDYTRYLHPLDINRRLVHNIIHVYHRAAEQAKPKEEMMKQGFTFAMTVLLLAGLVFSPAAQAESYDNTQIKYQARMLAERLGVPAEKTNDLINNLEMGFESDWFIAQMLRREVKAVFVYEAGKGGFIVNYMEGDGRISFLGDRQAAPIFIRSWSIGAQAGGGQFWGVGLIMDLKRVTDFGGDYQGKSQSATAWDSSSYNWVTFSKRFDAGGAKAHDIFLLQSGRGAFAGVAAERMTINPAW